MGRTLTSVPEQAVRSTPVTSASRLHTSAPSQGGEFSAGAMLGERYRIVGLIGKGGMGEVYRADDLTLDQPVALKFLPAALA